MTGITELALIAKIKKQLENFDTVVLKEGEAVALVEALEKSEKTSEARREAIDRAHNMFVRERDRANAAEEALEKAQGMEAYWKTQCRGITDHCEVLQTRIAELESHTVTLKLPQAVSAGGQGYQEQVERILTAAGIKVEDE